MKLKDDSRLVRFARFGGWRPGWQDHRNICVLVRYLVYAVLRSIVVAIALAVFGGCALALLALLFYAPLAWLFGWPAPSGMVEASAIIWSIIGTMAGPIVVFKAVRWVQDKREPLPPAPPGLVTTAWKSFKDKTCVMVEVE